MKKITSIILLLTIISSCLAVSGCEFGISEELEARIVEDYLIFSGIQSDKTPDEIEREFLGEYKDSVAVYFHTSGAYETPVTEEIAGYTFTYPDSRVVKIWNDGKFYKLPEAYELGLISDKNVKAIHFRYKKLVFKDPYFIYEPQSPFYANSDDFRCDCRGIRISLDKGISNKDKIFSEDFFQGIDIAKIGILHHDYYQKENGVIQRVPGKYRQTATIILVDQSYDNHIRAIEKAYQIEGVVSADFHCNGHLATIPNDELYYDESTSDVTFGQWALDKINLPKVWDFTVGSNAIKVGVIDTGIADHSDLNANYSMSDAWDFSITTTGTTSAGKLDADNHGTHMAGIVGAVGNNGIGISGVN